MSNDILLTITLFIIVVGSGIGTTWWVHKRSYKKAKDEIFNYVKRYKYKCTGANVFPVTVELLQNAFIEYDTELIKKVHKDLINEKVIEWDTTYYDWCIK